MPGVEDWSTTAASNATADSNINWAEGQAPSTINNSARAEMAAVAAWLRTMGAYGTVGGTADVITLTTTQTPSALGPALIGFIATADNTGAVTLNRDGLGAKPLRYVSGSDLSAGDIKTGVFYLACYTTASLGQWLIVSKQKVALADLPAQATATVLGNFSGGSAVPSAASMSTLGAALGYLPAPSGTKMLFQQTAAPTGWTKDLTHNNKALRVVSGTASSGGTVAFTTAFASQSVSGTVGATTLTSNQIPSHQHFVSNSDADLGGVLSNTNYLTVDYSFGPSSDYLLKGSATAATIGLTSATGGGASHDHTFTGTAIDLAVQYVDLIIATKD